MNKFYIVNLIVIVLVIVSVVTVKFVDFSKSNNIIATTTSIATGIVDSIANETTCTQETKQCPDGSYISRQGSKCEFKTCPELVKPVAVPSSPKIVPKAPVVNIDSSAGSVKIVSPANGTTFLAGSTINVRVITTGDINSVFIGSGFDSEIDNEAPYEVSFKIPLEFLGELPIAALGRNSGGLVDGDNVKINVITDAMVGPITLSPDDNLYVILGQTYPLTVYSKFSDGIKREITDKLGTTYRIMDPTVATVDKEGVVTGNKVGATLLEARNGDYSYEISVHVFDD